MRITAIEPQQRHPDRYNIALDGRFALGMDGALVVAEGLCVGLELSAADVERLAGREEERRLFDAAVRFLAPRPRSRAEVRRRLLAPRPNRPIPSREGVERILDRLEQMELLNDRDFADFWVENRERFSPRSARALGQELRQKGVARETAEQVSDPERDADRALAAARQRLHTLRGLEYEAFRTRLGQFLLRRGFSYAIARETVRQLWEELRGETVAAGDDEDGADDRGGDAETGAGEWDA
jgi:regulatory protein